MSKMTATLRSLLAGAVIASAPAASHAQEFINVLTGGTSGVYYPVGSALASLYGEKIPNVQAQVQSTKASVENLNLLQQGKGELAIALGDSVKFAWEGNEEVGFKAPLTKLRGIAAAYPNFIQIAATADSGVKTLADLKGKSLSVGAPKSGTELNARAILEAAGMSYDDMSKVEYLPFAESVELQKNRQLDATLQSAGVGVASIKDLATAMPSQIVSIPADVVEKLGAPYVAGVIPAGTYEGQTEDVPTVAVMNYFVSSEDVPEETAYQMTKLMFENLPTLIAAHKSAEQITLETALTGMPIPLHPGAERYYREVGVIK
jgi:TRAP transporter TAXI family solute receptor